MRTERRTGPTSDAKSAGERKRLAIARISRSESYRVHAISMRRHPMDVRSFPVGTVRNFPVGQIEKRNCHETFDSVEEHEEPAVARDRRNVCRGLRDHARWERL